MQSSFYKRFAGNGWNNGQGCSFEIECFVFHFTACTAFVLRVDYLECPQLEITHWKAEDVE